MNQHEQLKASNETKQPNNSQLDATDDRGGSILGHIWASIGVTLVLGVVCCGLYPLAVWAIGQAVFPDPGQRFAGDEGRQVHHRRHAGGRIFA